MKKINKVVILAGGEVEARIQDLFSQAGLKVVVSDSKADYAKELADADLVLETLPGDMELKKVALRGCD
jgi:hypothetical protein